MSPLFGIICEVESRTCVSINLTWARRIVGKAAGANWGEIQIMQKTQCTFEGREVVAENELDFGPESPVLCLFLLLLTWSLSNSWARSSRALSLLLCESDVRHPPTACASSPVCHCWAALWHYQGIPAHNLVNASACFGNPFLRHEFSLCDCLSLMDSLSAASKKWSHMFLLLPAYWYSMHTRQQLYS